MKAGDKVLIRAGIYERKASTGATYGLTFARDARGTVKVVSEEGGRVYCGCQVVGFPRWSLQWLYADELVLKDSPKDSPKTR